MVAAFIEAGTCALIAIAYPALDHAAPVRDVLLTLVPLLLAGIVTLEICVIVDLQLNFANIIALPLLLGVGVAFEIYYIMAWREGQTNLLGSPLTRAVIFRAARRRPPSAACGFQVIPARPAWASCWRFRC